MARIVDIVGRKFGRLTVVKKTEKRQKSRVIWECLCECENYCLANTTDLTTGHKMSCGCWSIENSIKAIKKAQATRLRHGMAKTATYRIWRGMLSRCYNKNYHKYPSYGARGITVCDRWRNSFEAFWEDMGERPEGLSLDRINNDGAYSTENCRWATTSQQSNNKRQNIVVTYQGRSQTIAQWAKELGIVYRTAVYRYHLGLPIDVVLSQGKRPVKMDSLEG